MLYGHLKLQSIEAKTDQKLEKGKLLGVLVQGFTQEIGNERKHLHLAIYRDQSVELRGYV